MEKIQGLRSLETIFEKYQTKNIQKEIRRVEVIINYINLLGLSYEDLTKMKMLNKQLDELLKIEETMLRQRSRAVWMKGGDKNMKFFHGKANQRSKVNSIDKIKGEHGVWWRKEDDIEIIFVSYFGEIFACVGIVREDTICEVVKDKLNEANLSWCT